MLAFSLAAKGELFQIVTDPSNVQLTTYGTQTKEIDGEIWITLINKDIARDAEVHTLLPAGYEAATAFRLSAPSIDDKEDVTLGGSRISENGSWNLPDGEPIADENRAINVLVPKASACLLRITRR